MYKYQHEKPWTLTNEGQAALFTAYKKAVELCGIAGAANGMKIVKDCRAGTSFQQMALLDRLVEIGSLREVTGPDVIGQHRVFVLG